MLTKFYTYQRALKFYKETQKAKIKKAHIRDQFERACLSIVLNLSEGSGKPTRKDRARFYSISMGSLREVQTILDILEESELAHEADELGALIYRLLQNPGGRN